MIGWLDNSLNWIEQLVYLQIILYKSSYLWMNGKYTVCVYMLLCVHVTLGKGERSCATGRFSTNGMVRRLGSTRKEAMASIIIVFDFKLRENESNKE